MNFILFSFSFLAGLQAFFAPCSVALIPAYVGYYVSEEGKGARHQRRQQLLRGLKAGLSASLGLMSVYAAFGALLAVLGRVIAPFVFWIELATGGMLIFLGAAMLLGYELSLQLPLLARAPSSGLKRFYFFGVAYALGAVGCTLPIFLLVVFQALAQGGAWGGVANFAAYALAMSALMIAFSLVAALSTTALQRFLNTYMPLIQKSMGLTILLAGGYLVSLALKVMTI